MEQMQATGAGRGKTATKVSVPESARAAFDQIWGAVFAEPQSGQGRTRSVLLTAAGRKEGVSTLLAGTALVGAALRDNLRVGLVDLNVRYPQLARLLAAESAPGLADVVAGKADLDAIAQPVGSSNLLFYPSGVSSGAAMQLLTAESLRDLLRQIAGRHDYLLCDCAAANLYPDAQILAQTFDGAVLVAEAGATRRESLAEAKKRIELGQGRVLGVVLNKRRYPVPRFLYRRS